MVEHAPGGPDRVLTIPNAVTVVRLLCVPLFVVLVARPHVAREALVVLGAGVVAAAGGRRVDVTLVGKAATLMMMCAFPLFLFGHAPISWHQGPEDAAWAFAIPGVVLAWVAAARYLPVAREAVAAGRRGPGSGISDDTSREGVT
jgi:phosphatidylglycerophosphate synthase